MKILITGGKSAVALKVLKAFENDEVVMADYGDVPSFSSSKYQMISLGEKNLDIVAHVLLNHCLDYQADVLLPLHEFEMEAVAKAEILFNEFNVNLLLPNTLQLQLYNDLPISSKNWLVVSEGRVVYSTKEWPEMANLIDGSLSGVFYVDEQMEGLNLRLVKI